MSLQFRFFFCRDLGASQSPHTPSLNSVTDDLQDFGIRLRASRERLDQLRRDVAASGLVLSQQGAGQSQNIVSDGLAYPSNHDGDPRGGATALSETFELLNQAAPIINVDDVRRSTFLFSEFLFSS